jgi:hypothetical protein
MGAFGGLVHVAAVVPRPAHRVAPGEVVAAPVEDGGEVGVVTAGDEVLDHVEIERGGLLQGLAVDAVDGPAVLLPALRDQVEGAVADTAVGVDAAVVGVAARRVAPAGHGVGLAEACGVLHAPDRSVGQVLADRPAVR